jgi:hypothetical protein
MWVSTVFPTLYIWEGLTNEEFVDEVSDRVEYEGAHNREMDRGITGRDYRKKG